MNYLQDYESLQPLHTPVPLYYTFQELSFNLSKLSRPKEVPPLRRLRPKFPSKTAFTSQKGLKVNQQLSVGVKNSNKKVNWQLRCHRRALGELSKASKISQSLKLSKLPVQVIKQRIQSKPPRTNTLKSLNRGMAFRLRALNLMKSRMEFQLGTVLSYTNGRG